MSKKVDYSTQGVNAFSNFIGGASDPQKDTNKADLEDNKTITSDEVKTEHTEDIQASEDMDKLTYDNKTKRFNKNNNYTITFKIDADITDYLKHIEFVSFIESGKNGKMEGTTKTEYVNELIRKDLKRLLGLSDDADTETMQAKWLEYKEKNNL